MAQGASAEEIASLHAQVEELSVKVREAESQRTRAEQERERIQSVLETFHEQNMSESNFELDKLRKAVGAKEEQLTAAVELEATLRAEIAELRSGPDPQEIDAKVAEVTRERDDVVLRMDQMAVEVPV